MKTIKKAMHLPIPINSFLKGLNRKMGKEFMSDFYRGLFTWSMKEVEGKSKGQIIDWLNSVK